MIFPTPIIARKDLTGSPASDRTTSIRRGAVDAPVTGVLLGQPVECAGSERVLCPGAVAWRHYNDPTSKAFGKCAHVLRRTIACKNADEDGIDVAAALRRQGGIDQHQLATRIAGAA